MKQALVVGIDTYDNPEIKNLKGCVNDANEISTLLKWNYSNPSKISKNFDVVSSLISSETRIDRVTLRKQMMDLFEDQETQLALFYFSGHGHQDNLGGHLVTQDANDFEEGISFNDLMLYANKSKIEEVILILDCCFSGHLGSTPISNSVFSQLREGVSVISSSKSGQYSIEMNGKGLFTSYLCKALEGQKADLLGRIKLTDLYEYLDMMLSLFEDQQPVLKLNVSKSTTVRIAKSKIDIEILKKIIVYFKGEHYRLKLNPSFIEDEGHANKTNEVIFSHLQLMKDCGLVKPKKGTQLYFTAINFDKCLLTDSGKYYWNMVKNKAI